MYSVVNVQAPLLKECIKERVPVTVFLLNGFQLKGIISNFDTLVILLETEGKQQMIYKHAISTIIPGKPVKVNTAEV